MAVSSNLPYIIIKTLSSLVAIILAHLSYKSYDRTDNISLGLLAAGFGCIGLGTIFAVSGGIFIGIKTEVVLIESLLLLLGLSMFAYSAVRRQAPQQ